MKHALRLGLLLGTFALAPAALADDSSATLGIGGIVLTQSADIRMATEDLYLSTKQVRVRYTFVNDSGKDIDTIVAFPLPDIDNFEYAETPMGATTGTTPNFVGFKLIIDGKPVAATVEEHALLKGKDVSAEVRAAGLPLSLMNSTFYDKINKLPAAVRDKLARDGLIEVEAPDLVHAKWLTTTRFWWHQHFPAGKTVTVDHTYQPVTGQTFFTPIALTDAEQAADYRKNYCLDASTTAAIRAGLDAMKKKGGNDGMYYQSTTDFVLVTGNNWKGPIGRFHLTIDKLKPDNILSMCWAGDLRKTGATRFESTLTNFAPKADVRILVLEVPPPGTQ